jgi:hypothetical protein
MRERESIVCMHLWGLYRHSAYHDLSFQYTPNYSKVKLYFLIWKFLKRFGVVPPPRSCPYMSAEMEVLILQLLVKFLLLIQEVDTLTNNISCSHSLYYTIHKNYVDHYATQ